MAESFDMSGAVRFDLAQGKVSLTAVSAVEPLQVVLPSTALIALARSLSTDQLIDFGHSVGHIFGARVLARLSKPSGATPAELVEHLGGEFALSGLGTLGLEGWGKTLVFTLVGCPVALADKPGANPWVSAILEAALTRVFGRELSVVSTPDESGTARFVVCSRPTGDAVRTWLTNGETFGVAVSRLNGVEVQK